MTKLFNLEEVIKFIKNTKEDDILSITIDKKYEFKPFDRVLVRDNEYEEWRAGIFSHFREGETFSFITVNNRYRQCIPYEGNEHLVGTTKKPE